MTRCTSAVMGAVGESGAYLKVATQLEIGQPMTKLLSELVLPSHTSSIQLAVHISLTRTWAFSLKCVEDLDGRDGTVSQLL